jgi:hypothetical protein
MFFVSMSLQVLLMALVVLACLASAHAADGECLQACNSELSSIISQNVVNLPESGGTAAAELQHKDTPLLAWELSRPASFLQG